MHRDRCPFGHLHDLGHRNACGNVQLPGKQRQIVGLRKGAQVGENIDDPLLSHGDSPPQTLTND